MLDYQGVIQNDSILDLTVMFDGDICDWFCCAHVHPNSDFGWSQLDLWKIVGIVFVFFFFAELWEASCQPDVNTNHGYGKGPSLLVRWPFLRVWQSKNHRGARPVTLINHLLFKENAMILWSFKCLVTIFSTRRLVWNLRGFSSPAISTAPGAANREVRWGWVEGHGDPA